MRNPAAKAYKVLGVSQTEWQAAKAALKAYCDANDDQGELAEADLRAVHPILADPRAWNELKDRFTE
jgi:hypothetical protein